MEIDIKIDEMPRNDVSQFKSHRSQPTASPKSKTWLNRTTNNINSFLNPQSKKDDSTVFLEPYSVVDAVVWLVFVPLSMFMLLSPLFLVLAALWFGGLQSFYTNNNFPVSSRIAGYVQLPCLTDQIDYETRLFSMLQQKTIIKKTKRGNIIKLVREHYLRNDISCGFIGCKKCADSQTRKLSGRLVLVDLDTIMNQIDVLEHHWFNNVIVLQSVLDSLRQKNSSLYNRVRNLISNQERSFFVFCNEHLQATYVDSNAEERPFKSIVKAYEYYVSHLETPIILISDTFPKDKLPSYVNHQTIHEFVTKESPELLELVAQTTDDSGRDQLVYEEYLSVNTVASDPERYKVGNINFVRTAEAYVTVNNENIKIIGQRNLNRSIHGDQVAIELINTVQDAMDVDDVQVDPEDDEYDTSTFAATSEKQGRVVCVLKRNTRSYCGSISTLTDLMTTDSTAKYHSLLFYPIDRKISRIRIKIRNPSMLANKRFVVNIDTWPTSSKYPLGHFVKIIGDIGDKNTESEVLLIEHDIPFLPFTQSVISCLPAEGDKWVVNDSHLAERRDLRHLDVCSIDPPNCTDIDDGLHAIPLPNGNIQVGVHIADVSHFVKPNTPMDDEAARRGTTVYLVDKRIDMLPGLLGTNLCSLHSNVDRLSFSVIWEMTPQAEVKNVEFTKSIIRSKASFTYDAAQERLDDKNATDSLSKSIKLLNSLAKILRAQRMQAGALTLSSPEVRFKLENDSDDPLDVELKQLKETNALVEEFMLLANIYVARKIYTHFPESSVLRRHPSPPESNFINLRKSLERFGLELDPTTSKTLSVSLDQCVLPNDSYFNTLVRILTTRCMYQAVYFCSGALSEPEFRHYGLCTDMYTHFTSPIRRYADLVVHRLLAACIGYDKSYTSDLVNKSHMQKITDNLNYRGRNAQQASRNCVQLYTQLFFKDKHVTEEAYIVSVFEKGVGVLIPKYGVENVIVLKKEGEDNLVYIPEQGIVRYRVNGKVEEYYVFKKVQVSIRGLFDEVGKRSKVVCELVV